MVCDPSDNTLNPNSLGPPPDLGFGVPFSPLQVPFPDVSLPEGIPEDLVALVQDIIAALPGGPFVPNLDNFAKDPLDALMSLLNQISPYLGFYRFIQSLFNMILCILDVLCALPNPFKVSKAMTKLFKRCLPDFLSLFPWVALLAMILALLLLLLELIQYLIDKITDFINEIIANLKLLAEAIQLNDSEATLAGARKIAQLLCLIEQLFAVLIAFQAIFAIIQALAQIAGRTACAPAGSTGGDDSECCTEEVCPPFISQSPDGISGTFGRLIYHSKRESDTSGFSALGLDPDNFSFQPLREERWQFIDTDGTKKFKFLDIITEIDGNIFYPEGISFESDSNLKKVPYTVDLTLDVNPADFGHTDPIGGKRTFQIKDCIVVKKPTIGVLKFDNSLDDTTDGYTNGTFFLEGGKVFESDGETEFNINDKQATLNNFISLDPGTGLPSSSDAVVVDNINYTWNINHEALMLYNIITVGCRPSIEVESSLVNSNFDISDALSRIGNLPDVGTISPPSGALGCLTEALAEFREDVSPEGAASFQAKATACLEDLREDTLGVFEKTLCEGTSRFNSTIEIDPELQFLTQPITISVTLKDSTDTVISKNIPESVAPSISTKLSADVTIGNISNFEYDGYEKFVAEITSSVAGTGQLTIFFEGEEFANIIGREDDAVTTSIETNQIEYRFIGSGLVGEDEIGDVEPARRRDETDVARDSEG